MSREDKITEIANFIQNQTPNVWDIEAISKTYPTDYNESMNTVLVQELIRYNRLLEVMAITLTQVKKALVGQVVMSEELELVANCLHDNQVPTAWSDKGHLSLQPLMSWVEDLNKRVKFLNNWIENGTPKVFWISGKKMNYIKLNIFSFCLFLFPCRFLLPLGVCDRDSAELCEKESHCY